MRFRLRTLLIWLAILPPLLAVGWLKYGEWNAERQRRAAEFERPQGFSFSIPALGARPIAGPVPASASSGVTEEESDGQVFSFHIEIAR